MGWNLTIFVFHNIIKVEYQTIDAMLVKERDDCKVVRAKKNAPMLWYPVYHMVIELFLKAHDMWYKDDLWWT